MRREHLTTFFSFPIPCVFITKGQAPDAGSRRDRGATPGSRSSARSSRPTSSTTRIKPWLEEEFAPTTNLHGSLADVFGVGLLFVGQERHRQVGVRARPRRARPPARRRRSGHRAPARHATSLIGRGHELQRHHMEIRGVGLIDIPSIFGMRAVRQQKRIEVVVQLEQWDHDAAVDRTGLDTETTTILDVRIAEDARSAQSGKEHHRHRRSDRDESSAQVQRHRSGASDSTSA